MTAPRKWPRRYGANRMRREAGMLEPGVSGAEQSASALLTERRAAVQPRSASTAETIEPHPVARDITVDGRAERKRQGRACDVACSFSQSPRAKPRHDGP